MTNTLEQRQRKVLLASLSFLGSQLDSISTTTLHIVKLADEVHKCQAAKKVEIGRKLLSGSALAYTLLAVFNITLIGGPSTWNSGLHSQPSNELVLCLKKCLDMVKYEKLVYIIHKQITNLIDVWGFWKDAEALKFVLPCLKAASEFPNHNFLDHFKNPKYVSGVCKEIS
jgi:hypothetical protein